MSNNWNHWLRHQNQINQLPILRVYYWADAQWLTTNISDSQTTIQGSTTNISDSHTMIQCSCTNLLALLPIFLLLNSPTYLLIFMVSSLIYWTSVPAGSCFLRRIPTQVVIIASHLPIFTSIFFCKIDPGKENSSSEIFYFPLQFEKSLKLSVRP